ncbi:MAG: DNA-3-methyladenine glycosylase [Bacillota bacterium]
MILKNKFFIDKTENVAKNLLGKEVVRIIDNEKIICKIVETEAYIGPMDKASHSFDNKRTKRTETMFKKGGTIYIYLIYGMYHLLNIVTEKKDYPSAVLIRAIEPISGLDQIKKNRNIKSKKKVDLTNGPGKLTQALKIDKSLNGKELSKRNKLYIQDSKESLKDIDIVKSKRINIDYAKEWKDKLLRFYIKNNKYISKK